MRLCEGNVALSRTRRNAMAISTRLANKAVPTPIAAYQPKSRTTAMGALVRASNLQ